MNKTSLLLALAVIACTLQLSLQNESDKECITVYSECDFKGQSVELCQDNPNIPFRIKSIKQQPSDEITIYRKVNYEGETQTYVGSTSCITYDDENVVKEEDDNKDDDEKDQQNAVKPTDGENEDPDEDNANDFKYVPQNSNEILKQKKLNMNDYLVYPGLLRSGKCIVGDNGDSLTIQATGESQCIVPVSIRPGSTLTFNVEFSNPRNKNLGRHGGLMLSEPRLAPGRILCQKGFVIDYIDQKKVRGYRTYYFSGNMKNYLNQNQEPAKQWKIVWDTANHFTFFGDGKLIAEVTSTKKPYTAGNILFWVTQGNAKFSNIVVDQNYFNVPSPLVRLQEWNILQGPAKNGKCLVEDNGQTLIIQAVTETQCFIGKKVGPKSQISFTVEFSDPKDKGVGRHGGIMLGEFVPQRPRYPPLNGFVFDYIDRNDPRGYRSYAQGVAIKNAKAENPGKNWKIVWDTDTHAALFVDNQKVQEITTKKKVPAGSLFFWAWPGKVKFSNIKVESL